MPGRKNQRLASVRKETKMQGKVGRREIEHHEGEVDKTKKTEEGKVTVK